MVATECSSFRSPQAETSDSLYDLSTKEDPNSLEAEPSYSHGRGIEQYLHCRLEDWENAYRRVHPNRSLRVDYLLTELNLGGLHMGAIPSAEFFKSLPYLRYLWLQNNNLTNLNGVLLVTPRILGLWLGNNQLSNLHHELGSLHSLEVLDLSVNELHDFAGTLQELRSIHTLKELDLSGNAITLMDNYESIILCQNSSLHFLDRKHVQPGALERARNIVTKLNRPSLEQIGFGKHCPKRLETGARSKIPRWSNPKMAPRSSPTLNELLQKRFNRKVSVTFKHLDWASVPQSQERRNKAPPDHATFTIIKAKF
ncbi:hypothetical protein D915_002851 [Fasciola hepatica]|uniref:Leucine Rich repeat-containing domain protein n=1 Tax=Fasciola hepatica TaxID=6192 RepID=A0A4E0RGC1_FASHE|nr:hypothetical protein D915_002851 [Fasciola hepatica]